MKSTSKSKNELIKELNDLREENIKLKIQFEEWKASKESSGIKQDNNIESFWGSPSNAEKEIQLNNIKKLFEDYIKMYAGRDDSLTQHFSEDFSGFTGGGDFLVKDKKEWVDITRQDFAQVKDPIRIEMKDLSIQSLTSDIAVTTGFFLIHLPIKDNILSRETARLVLIFRKENDGWKISHSSISIPYSLVGEGEVYPMRELVKRNQLLEELIAERTNQVSIANNNLKQINKELAKEISMHKLVEKELHEIDQKYRLLVDSANEGIVVIQNGILQLTNPMSREMTGYPVEEIDSMPFERFVHPEDRARLVENHRDRLNGRDLPNHYVFRLQHKDGSTRWVYMNAVLINWEGNPATLNFLTDISNQKQTEEALLQSSQKWEGIISASPDGIGIISLDGKIKHISEKLIKMHGYSNEKMNDYLGRSIFDFIDPLSHATLIENTKKLLSGEKRNSLTEYIALKEDKSKFYIDINATILNDSAGKPDSILYVERDITERKKTELIIQNQFNQLQALNNDKDKFFSIIAHDLRSPFQSLLGSSELLATEVENLSHEEIVLFSTGLHSSLKNLYGLLENLLQWSMVQRGLIEFKPGKINIYNLVNKIIELSNQNAEKKNISIFNKIDNKIFTKADNNMLRSIFQNLINNSIKFTSIGGNIIISAKENNDLIEVSVQDDGIGMSPEKTSLLFKQNIHNTTELFPQNNIIL